MLCYSFYGEQLNLKDEAKLGTEAFENIYKLFSLLLCLLLKREVKKGIHREYINTNEELKTVHGKIDINKTINNNSLTGKKIYCEFSDYSDNCLLNQIIKTTLFYLLKSDEIGNTVKDEIKRMLNYFLMVDLIDIRSIRWEQVKFNRNNLSYKYIVDLCQLILNGLIVSDEEGDNKFKEFLDDTRVSAIFENFIKAYFRKHYPELNASSRKLYLSDKPIMNIPMMKTDITLEYDNRMLIIDAKFYSKILKESYNSNCKTISNSHLNQIYVYVDSQDPNKTGNVKGMLLYAQTINEPSVEFGFSMIGHDIFIRTLDMNEEWDNIRKRLNLIAETFKENTLIVY